MPEEYQSDMCDVEEEESNDKLSDTIKKVQDLSKKAFENTVIKENKQTKDTSNQPPVLQCPVNNTQFPINIPNQPPKNNLPFFQPNQQFGNYQQLPYNFQQQQPSLITQFVIQPPPQQNMQRGLQNQNMPGIFQAPSQIDSQKNLSPQQSNCLPSQKPNTTNNLLNQQNSMSNKQNASSESKSCLEKPIDDLARSFMISGFKKNNNPQVSKNRATTNNQQKVVQEKQPMNNTQEIKTSNKILMNQNKEIPQQPIEISQKQPDIKQKKDINQPNTQNETICVEAINEPIDNDLDKIFKTRADSIRQNLLPKVETLFSKKFTSIIPIQTKTQENSNNIITVVLINNSSLLPQQAQKTISIATETASSKQDDAPLNNQSQLAVNSQSQNAVSSSVPSPAISMPSSAVIQEKTSENQSQAPQPIINNDQSNQTKNNQDCVAINSLENSKKEDSISNQANEILNQNNSNDLNEKISALSFKPEDCLNMNSENSANENEKQNKIETEVNRVENIFEEEVNQILGNTSKSTIDCMSFDDPNKSTEQITSQNTNNQESNISADQNIINEQFLDNNSENKTNENNSGEINNSDNSNSKDCTNNDESPRNFESLPSEIAGMKLDYLEKNPENKNCDATSTFTEDNNIDKNSIYIGQANTATGTISIYKDPNGVFFLRGNLPDCSKNRYKLTCS